MIIRTEAIVLRSLDYGETSRIVTLFTRARGKLAVLARGARLPKSRFGATLQPMSFIQAVFYYKPTRALQTLSESTHVQLFQGIGRDLEKLTLGLRSVELVYALLQEEEQNPHVFNLLVQVLRRLDEAEDDAPNLLPYFQLRLAGTLGFAPAVEREALQQLPEEGGLLALSSGRVLPSHTPAADSYQASRAALRAFGVLARAPLDTVMRMRLTSGLRSEVEHAVEAYLRYHLEDAYPSRGSKVMDQLRRSFRPPGP